MDTKTCNICKNAKSITDFHKCKSIPDGFSRHCKQCHKEMNRKWRKTPKGRDTVKSSEQKYRSSEKGKTLEKRLYERAKGSHWQKSVRERAQTKYLSADDNYRNHLARCRAYLQTEPGQQSATKSRTSNKGKRRNRLHQQNRRARKIKATPCWFSDFDKHVLQELVMKAQTLEKSTGVKYHIDHIIPLQGKNVCGLHYHKNWQLVTASENLKKKNLLIEEDV